MNRLLEKLADDKPLARKKREFEAEVTILERNSADGSEDSLKEEKPDEKKVVQSLIEQNS